ncbi:M23 family metallopeptidase [Rhodocytophaga rosea]|uniref:M23 family metallopeptidase n=1 Tax=Rhodocytophaga rosea TaxID=2704465 RepID=A0A6C0GRC4_9BACT|nr:M23 family metallopeptidase [Rhodocytophaga rosea]QHT70153.1 M23 family metallopeptidase [Rhodocytophaga rosea]
MNRIPCIVIYQARNLFGFCLLVWFALGVNSPSVAQKNPYPKGYFMFPIKPGQTNFLTGNMGELRSNHFHGGLDIRTDGREGLPVYAAADGYVARIKVTTGGYGNALYIVHPNGYMTVYGHLKTYNKVLGDYLRQQQYAGKTFEIDVVPAKNQFPIKKGEIVAYSGNTGGSGGPHLHFEIRDTLDNLLNPLYFGFTEIKDNTPPTISKLVVRTLDVQARVNDAFGRTEFTPQKSGTSSFTIPQAIPVWGQVGFELLAFDMSDGTHNKNGVTCIEIKVDGKEIYSHQLEIIPIELNRHINTHIDYELSQYSSNRFQRCYVADGNRLGIYKTTPQRGRITINDTKPHQVTIAMWDAHQNVSRLSFTLKGTPPTPQPAVLKPVSLQTGIESVLFENTLKISAKNPGQDNQAVLFSGSKTQPLTPSYFKNNEAIYLWDMRKGLPDSVQVNGVAEIYNFKKLIASGRKEAYERDSLWVTFPASALYDTLYLEAGRKEDIFQVGKFTTPLHESIDIRITPGQAVPQENRIRTGIYYVKGKSLSYRGGTWTNNQISFKTRELGSFTIATDTVPPLVKLNTKTPQKFTCKISDNLSGIYSFSATLNGQWILMQYDYKQNLIWSDPLDTTQPLKGKLVVEVVDNAGNNTIFETNL